MKLMFDYPPIWWYFHAVCTLPTMTTNLRSGMFHPIMATSVQTKILVAPDYEIRYLHITQPQSFISTLTISKKLYVDFK